MGVMNVRDIKSNLALCLWVWAAHGQLTVIFHEVRTIGQHPDAERDQVWGVNREHCAVRLGVFRLQVVRAAFCIFHCVFFNSTTNSHVSRQIKIINFLHERSDRHTGRHHFDGRGTTHLDTTTA
jgi:hypothetical protein